MKSLSWWFWSFGHYKKACNYLLQVYLDTLLLIWVNIEKQEAQSHQLWILKSGFLRKPRLEAVNCTRSPISRNTQTMVLESRMRIFRQYEENWPMEGRVHRGGKHLKTEYNDTHL